VLSAVASFVSSLTGKVALGTALAAAGVGTAHAAHVVDLPGAPRAQTEVVLETQLDDQVPTTTTEAPDSATTTTTTTPATTTTSTSPSAVDTGTDADDEGDAGATETNHGQIVSEFAHTTELEGCERGQAIADLASGGRSAGNPPLDHCAKSDDEDDIDQDDPAVEPTVSSTGEASPKTTTRDGNKHR
jgi:hypothetical protein